VTVIGLMLPALADRYQLDWNRARISEFAGAIGTGALLGFGLRYGLRELLKLIPLAGTFVGGAVNAMAASALIYAIGRAACVYLGEVRKGQVVSSKSVASSRGHSTTCLIGRKQKSHAIPAPSTVKPNDR
jgi:uncharacterized protein (DUF697 family)